MIHTNTPPTSPHSDRLKTNINNCNKNKPENDFVIKPGLKNPPSQ